MPINDMEMNSEMEETQPTTSGEMPTKPAADAASTTPGATAEAAPQLTEAELRQAVTDMQKRIKELNAENAKHRKAAEAEAAGKTDAEKRRMQEAGQFKELAEKAAQELAQVQAEKAALARQILVWQVSAKLGLPSVLADRLKGDTLEELEADAKVLLALVPPKPAARDANADGNKGGASPAKSDGAFGDLPDLAAVAKRYNLKLPR